LGPAGSGVGLFCQTGRPNRDRALPYAPAQGASFQGLAQTCTEALYYTEQNISNGPSSLSLSRSKQAILKARRYVEAHLEEKIAEKILASYCGLSPAYFSRTFKRVTGLSFSAFLPQARIKRAMQLLAHESLTVTQVCAQAGFGNVSHFAVMFRRYVGVSPSIYRARLQQSRSKGLWDRIYKTLRYALTHTPLLLGYPLEPARVVV
jgi:AraC-like DNA-binding protein